MNSLQDLNFYSENTVPFGDDRPYSITFSSNIASNANIITSEGVAFASNAGIDITEVISSPSDIVYTINVSSLANTTVAWPNPLPSGLTSNITSPGVYNLYGVNGATVWNEVKAANISPPRDYSGTFYYTSTITYPNVANTLTSNTFSWTNQVQVLDIADLAFSSNVANVIYNQYQQTTINPYVQIVDAEADGLFTMVITANGTSAINSMTSGGTGGTVSYDSGQRKYTISGVRSEVNSHLRSLYFNPEYNYISNFLMYYTLISPSGNQSDQKTQNLIIGNVYPVLTSAGNITYSQDTAFNLTNYPGFPDDSNWIPAPTYTLSITPNTTLAISTMTTAGSGGSASFNNTSKVMTITGTRLQIISHLNSLVITPATYYNQNFSLTYLITSPGGNPVGQSVNIGAVGVVLSNVDDIPYDEDVIKTQIDVPEIIDTNFGIASITLPFTMNITPANLASISSIVSTGNLGASKSTNVSTKSYTIAGNLAQIRSELGNVSITPGVDFANDFDLYYTLNTASGNVNSNTTQHWLIGGVNVETINSTDNRYYVKNNIDNLFPNSVPQVYETVGGSPEYRVELALGSNIGTIFASDDNYTIGNVITGYSNITSNVSANVITTINFNGTMGTKPNINLVANVSMTYYGNTSLTTSYSKFGNASLSIPAGTTALSQGLQLNPPNSTYFDFGTNDFTIECWVYFPTLTGVNGNQIFDFRAFNGNDGRAYSDWLVVSGSSIYYNIWLGTSLTGTRPIAVGSWTHLAISRVNGTFKTFINGLLDINIASSANLTAGSFTATPKIGTRYATGGGGVAPMYIDDLRIIKGQSLYKEPFLVPSTELSNSITITTGVPIYQYKPITNNWYSGNLTYSITGNKTQVNNKLANILFAPDQDISTTSNITYTQFRSGTLQTTSTFGLIGSDSTYTQQVLVYNTPGTYTLTLSAEDILYRSVDMILAGGGGGGGCGNSGNNIWGAGGGAGGYLEYANINLAQSLDVPLSNTFSKTFTFIVGSGGYQANYVLERGDSGNYTSVSGLRITSNAIGGGGGASSQSFDSVLGKYCAGGSGGSGGGSVPSRQGYQGSPGTGTIGQGNDGGYGNNAFGVGGGGGGGAATAGGGSQDIPSGAMGYYVGGAGKYNNITGANVYYSVGGEPSWTVHSSGTVPFTTPGSGGYGGYWIPSTGQIVQGSRGSDGVLVIKLK
jgi:hypothetical protein